MKNKTSPSFIQTYQTLYKQFSYDSNKQQRYKHTESICEKHSAASLLGTLFCDTLHLYYSYMTSVPDSVIQRGCMTFCDTNTLC